MSPRRASLLSVFGERVWMCVKVNYLKTNLFGKSLYELISDGMQGKGSNMNEQVQMKLHGALQKIANDGCNGMICIML